MPFETPTLPALIARTQNDLAGDALRQSDSQVLARAVSGAVYGLFGYLDWIARQVLPDSADVETLERAATLRLKEPRKAAQAASGWASFTAIARAAVDSDTMVQARDGRRYRVSRAINTVAGANTVELKAVEAGVLGNAEAGLQLTLVQPMEGVSGTLTVLPGGLTGGVAQESVEALRARVVRSYRVIPHGGNRDDYVTWALEVPGVTRAWCIRNYMGPGTVGVFVMRDDDPDPVPSASRLAEVHAYIETVRPVCGELFVLAPQIVSTVYRIKLSPDTSAVRLAVQKKLQDLHLREADLGVGLLRTHISEAISGSAGENDHVLSSPMADLPAMANQMLTFGGCEWLG